MAKTFKTFLSDDIITKPTLLHEAIPFTGSVLFGTYGEPDESTSNIKQYSHGMYQSVYDYTHTLSSANHIFDLTLGVSATNPKVTVGASIAADKTKKQIIYNEFSKILAGHDENGAIRQFDEDGDLSGGDKVTECFIISIARLLNKDEIKKGTFYLDVDVTSAISLSGNCRGDGAVAATASLAFPTAGGVVTGGQKLIITSTDGTAVTYTAGNGEDLSINQFEAASNLNDTIGSLKNVITNSTNASNHKDKITAVAVGSPGSHTSLTLTQDVAGSAGHKVFAGDITPADLTIGGTTWVTGETAFTGGTNGTRSELRIKDPSTEASHKINSPAGDYGILECDTFKTYTIEDSCTDNATLVHEVDYASLPAGMINSSYPLDIKAGLIFYQAGVVVLNPLIFQRYGNATSETDYFAGDSRDGRLPGSTSGLTSPATNTELEMDSATSHIDDMMEAQSINTCATALRKRINKISFNNTTEINSTIYFCNIGNNDFNYSSNPTYLGANGQQSAGFDDISGKIRVKETVNTPPVSFITTVGLYATDGELLAVAKLSNPIKNTPTDSFILKVRLDY